MGNTTVTAVNYEESHTVQMQGKRRDIEKYLKKGYHVKEERNGYWVLVKDSRVKVTLTNSTITRTFNMKEDIREHYNRTRVTAALIKTFSKDINSGKIVICMDSDGMYTFN
ncbi:MAG: hypothetical protein PHD15_04540 [Clostridia bacterium]|nr:hypothetical protein [Clostridia bacterium]MDD4387008.1 hypothetical protein [Clostridia bacterium]